MFFIKKQTLFKELREMVYDISASITIHLPGGKLLSFWPGAEHLVLTPFSVTILRKYTLVQSIKENNL